MFVFEGLAPGSCRTTKVKLKTSSSSLLSFSRKLGVAEGSMSYFKRSQTCCREIQFGQQG